jgi:hypothetical protein
MKKYGHIKVLIGKIQKQHRCRQAKNSCLYVCLLSANMQQGYSSATNK